MSVENVENHMAHTCKCGSVNFALLKSGAIECNICSDVMSEAKWLSAQPVEEHSLSLSYQIRSAIKAEDALRTAKQEVANLNELLNASYVDPTGKSGLSALLKKVFWPSKLDKEILELVASQAIELEELGKEVTCIPDMREEIVYLKAQIAAKQAQVNSDAETEAIKRFGHTERAEAFVAGWAAAQQAQLDPFTPDWSQDSAAAESIREHQAICNLLLKEMRHIAGISTGQVKRVAEQALEAVQQAQPEQHLFEFWWAEYMPDATQEQAFKAWAAAPSSKGVGIEQAQPERAPLSLEKIIEIVKAIDEKPGMSDIDVLVEMTRAIEAHHGIKQGGQ